jgi:hypothetical protein
MRSLHHETNACRAYHVCLYVRKIQLKNSYMDLDEIWYGSSAIPVYPKIVPFSFLQQKNQHGG